jgi:hypothetical protein
MKGLTPVEFYTLVVVHIGTVFAVLYPLEYRKSPWRSSESGPALMFKAVALAALFVVSVVGFWWPFPGYDLIYAVVVTAVVVGIIQQRAVMRRLQHRSRESRPGEF